MSNLKETFHDYDWNPKYFGIIVGLFCGLYIITSAIVPKIISIGPLYVPAGILTFPLCCILTDILTEVYGFNRTRQAIWTALVCTILFAFFSYLTILLPPAPFWSFNEDFKNIFSVTPRICIAGCIAWVIGEFMNTYIMSKMKIAQHAKNISLRFIASTVVAQLFDSAVFMAIAFGGILNTEQLIKMILTGWGLKVCYEIVLLPLSIPITIQIKKLEGVEHFDKQKLSII